MDLAVMATVFAVVFVAELPDKSLFASLILGTRHRGLWVWAGVSAAFVVHVVIAVLAGGLLTLLPSAVVEVVVAVLFAVGAFLLLRPEGEQDDDPEQTAAAAAGGAPTALKVISSCFAVVFVAEWGDVTQLAIANLAARYDDPLSVGVGAAAGLVSVAGLAILGGARLLARIPLPVVRRGAGLILAAFAVASASQLLG
jgi:putative Ca2+/H+ antiporter (TMEM165/GDT1 family)